MFVKIFQFNEKKKAWTGHVNDRCDDVEDLVLEKAHVGWVEGSNLQNITKHFLKNSKDEIAKGVVKFFEFSSDDKKLLHWQEESKSYRVFNSANTWEPATFQLLGLIPSYKKSQAKKVSSAVAIDISGYRKANQGIKTDAGASIPKLLQQSSYKTECNCVYLVSAFRDRNSYQIYYG